MFQIPYVEPNTYLFRFLNHRTEYFWQSLREMLAEQQLYLSSRTRFNDPLDSQPQIDNDLTRSEIQSYADSMFQNPWGTSLGPTKIATLLNLRKRGKTKLGGNQINNIKNAVRRTASEFLDQCGITSFSMTASQLALWGCYAAGSEGICVVFKRGQSMQSAFSLCAKVSYVPERPRLALSLLFQLVRAQRNGEPFDHISDQVLYLSLLHKSNHWAHEKEARIFLPDSAETKIRFARDELISILLGPRSSTELEEKVKEEVRSLAPTIAIHRTSLSESGYELFLPDGIVNIEKPQT